mgnify:CR=1 FL=1
MKKGAPPVISISTEKRQGNKRVTKVSGLEAFLADPEQVIVIMSQTLVHSIKVVTQPRDH